MSFNSSENFRMVIFQDEIGGVLTDLMARSHVDNVIFPEAGGVQKSLATKLAELIAEINSKAASTAVAQDIKTATDNLYNKIMGITGEEGDTVNAAYDTLKEVATYLAEHGSVVQGFTTSISGLQEAVQALQDGMTTVTQGDSNGSVKVNGTDVTVYTHPATHPADMITDTASKVIMTADERTKLAGVAANASAIVAGEGTVADAAPVSKLMIKILPDPNAGSGGGTE